MPASEHLESDRITGERVAGSSDGLNPNLQRHAAAYALSADLLPEGRILDLGCGVGHSYALLGSHETVGVDLDPAALAEQDRETRVADMRDLPFADAEFDGVISVQAIEHVPDPAPVLAEAARVMGAHGTAIFVTPNRLTLARPDEVINPYHFVEYSPDELATACRTSFASVRVLGLFGSLRFNELAAEQRDRLERVLRLDPLRLRRLAPRRALQRFNDWKLARDRAGPNPRAAAITIDDFELSPNDVDSALDLVAVCSSPLR
jgi:SAM-dependent methyltransferase